MENNVYVTAGKYELPESERNIKYCNSYPTIELAIQDIIDKQLTDYPFCEIEVDNKVISIRGIEIKPKQTPLPIPDELWKFIKPEFKYAALDGDGSIYSYVDEPKINNQFARWFDGADCLLWDLVQINTDGIDWRLSLTKRPEGL